MDIIAKYEFILVLGFAGCKIFILLRVSLFAISAENIYLRLYDPFPHQVVQMKHACIAAFLGHYKLGNIVLAHQRKGFCSQPRCLL